MLLIIDIQVDSLCKLKDMDELPKNARIFAHNLYIQTNSNFLIYMFNGDLLEKKSFKEIEGLTDDESIKINWLNYNEDEIKNKSYKDTDIIGFYYKDLRGDKQHDFHAKMDYVYGYITYLGDFINLNKRHWINELLWAPFMTIVNYKSRNDFYILTGYGEHFGRDKIIPLEIRHVVNGELQYNDEFYDISYNKGDLFYIDKFNKVCVVYKDKYYHFDTQAGFVNKTASDFDPSKIKNVGMINISRYNPNFFILTKDNYVYSYNTYRIFNKSIASSYLKIMPLSPYAVIMSHSDLLSRLLSSTKMMFTKTGVYKFESVNKNIYFHSTSLINAGPYRFLNPNLINITQYNNTKYIQNQQIAPISTDLEKTDNTFTRRVYDLPTIHPNEETTMHIEGTVLNKDLEQYFVNQAWVTSDSTPRSGITTSEVTGDNMEKGGPAIPKLPDKDNFDPTKVPGTKGLAHNESIDKDEVEHDDLADQTPAKVAANPKVLKSDKMLSGYAWYDKNNNSLRDDNAPSSNISVTAFNKELGMILGETKTDDKGFWKIEGLPDGEYDIHYNITNHKYEDKIWQATKVNISGSDKDNDSDTGTDGYVIRSIRPIQKDESHPYGAIGSADLGLVTVNGSVHITKAGIKGHDNIDDDDTIYGNLALTDKQEPYKTEVQGLGDTNTGRIKDSDDDVRTQGYSFNLVNDGQQSLTNIKLSDKTLQGNDALINNELKYYPDGKTVDTNTKLEIKDGTIMSNGKPFVMKPGSKIYGALNVAFTKDKDVHENEMSITAGVLSSDGSTVVSEVKDKDKLKTKYVYRSARKLKLVKYGAENGDQLTKDGKISDKAVTLDNVKFKIEKVVNANIQGITKKDYKYEEIGTYNTKSKGELELELDEGLYRITELKTKSGYELPTGDGWFVKASYDKKGNGSVSITADSNMPYGLSESDDGKTENYWGEVKIVNYKSAKIPPTGSRVLLIFTSIGIGLVFAGIIVVLNKRKHK